MSITSERLKVLLLSSPASECALLLQQVLAEHVELVTATSLTECLQLLESPRGLAAGAVAGSARFSAEPEAAAFDAFLCDWCYQGGTWRNALELVRRTAPEVPVIVVCRTGGEEEGTQGLEAG